MSHARADIDETLRARRADAIRTEVFSGPRPAKNIAVDEDVTRDPLGDGDPGLAFDGDDATSWRGATGAREWMLVLPFRRPVHVGWIRALFGDDAAHGVPAEYRVEHQVAVDGGCHDWAAWVVTPQARHHDRDGNEFAYGPSDVHAQRQVLFANVTACAVRVVVTAMNSGEPVVRELRIYESASPLAFVGDAAGNAFDERYETSWTPKGAGPWTLQLRLAQPTWVDRLRLVLGADAVTVPRADGPGRSLSARALPLGYRIDTRADDGEWVPLGEASPPVAVVAGEARELPVRRRLVHFAPRPVRDVRITIPRATDGDGIESASAFPFVRDLALYAADDARPVLPEPSFLSVNANPAIAAKKYKGGEAAASGQFARDVHHRLRRIVVGFSSDTRWPADAAIRQDAGAGRFLEVVDGDDPVLDAAFLQAQSPPPLLFLSGSLDWEFDRHTLESERKRGHVRWNVAADATSDDRGMGQLRDVVQGRLAPLVGFCGGAQIIALLESGGDDYDAILFRNDNSWVRDLVRRKDVFERAWWSDPRESDPLRPTFRLEDDGIFRFASEGPRRVTTRALPSSHGDAIRASAYARLPRLREIAHTDLCAPWVHADGPEPTVESSGARCVHVSQAFRGVGGPFPIFGFQFHPEQRDLSRVAPHDPDIARGDALQLLANTVDEVVLAWLSSLAR